MKSYKFSEKEIRSFLYWAISHEIERGLDSFDKNLKNKLEIILNEKDK